MQADKIAIVYWLHLKEHTDVFTQGYVGVTTRLMDIRFKEHCARYKSAYNPNNPLHLAFNAHGMDSIIITRLCVCSEREAYDVERVFRPFEYMGWNTSEGGRISKMSLEIIKRKKYVQ